MWGPTCLRVCTCVCGDTRRGWVCGSTKLSQHRWQRKSLEPDIAIPRTQRKWQKSWDLALNHGRWFRPTSFRSQERVIFECICYRCAPGRQSSHIFCSSKESYDVTLVIKIMETMIPLHLCRHMVVRFHLLITCKWYKWHELLLISRLSVF